MLMLEKKMFSQRGKVKTKYLGKGKKSGKQIDFDLCLNTKLIGNECSKSLPFVVLFSLFDEG